MKTFRLFLLTALLLSCSGLLVTTIQAANLPSLQDAFSGSSLSETAGTAGYSTTNANALGLASNIISIIIGLVGVIFLVLVLYGGFLWMTATGNEKQVETAKNIIVRAVSGTVIVLLAYAITYFIIKLLPQLN